MVEPFLSSNWYRVCGLKPKLRLHARIHRHRYRGSAWYVIQDAASGKSHRFTPVAYYFIANLDGRQTVDAIWNSMVDMFGDSAPSQDETIGLLTQLHVADLIRHDTQPDALEAFDRFSKQSQALLKRNLKSPLSLTLPLFDPDRFLKAALPFCRGLFGKLGLVLWVVVVAPALYLASLHSHALSQDISDRVFAAQGLLLIALVYPVVKLLHELGHGLTTRAFGGEVHEMGLMFLVFFPVPYVNASASAGFRSKYQRAAVAGAGILVETLLAAFGLYVWLTVETGVVRAIAFDVMLVAGLSTVLVNGNPLLKFDGYFVLADLVEMPNLAQRSSEFWGRLVERYAFGVEKERTLPLGPGERIWLLAFAPASFIYRMLVLFGISLFVATHYLILGILVALWGIVSGVALPAAKMLWHVIASPRLRRHRMRAVVVTSLTLLAGTALLFAVPAPHLTMSQGVIWLPEEAYVRAGADGFLRELKRLPGSPVEPGQPLFESTDPVLEMQSSILKARVRELDLQFRAERFVNRAQAEVTRKELDEAQAELDRAQDRFRHLVATSAAAGVLVVEQSEDMPERFFRQGAILGYVTPPAGSIVRVVVSQDDIDLVREKLIRVTVRMPGQSGAAVPAEILREVPAAYDKLPSKALTSSGGGAIAVDPRDAEGLNSLRRWFQFDLKISADALPPAFGSRVYVRFELEWEPVGLQMARRVRQLFLSQFHA
ncbi:peptidase M50 [Mesorhizobium sp. M7A.F.Ca.CA.001.09.2.1]|uniref:Peptidase M50 n=7 Tax=Mesorhizobium TaxID=68287 RepID=A0AB38TKG7_9HYPH|nr:MULTISPECIES: hypothetical protein [Mesorhizobium]MDF3216823.1 peptidase M50 [Mesorhizobium ciceri]RUY76746.1 peptidase M50 [Mesorhizobium sp. M7A.F.Ca.CA.001.09.2.1]RUZ08096.1 peptidase M50 [Mesorhizobium sp. M7A.F.Ca.CA.001.04.2.1]RUZ23064.1 peptidase M50 [Mesorhizobium sp. M7A.F.Ca.CA.001.09.1.1]RUZ38395.1 peptidase M50 [Mesorhizobium sp. M7A.F.Ca.CA.001.15.1.1]